MNQASQSDIDLINGLVNQDEILISRFYDLYFDCVKKIVVSNKGTTEDAMDLFQDSVFVLYQKIKQNGFSLSSSLKTYILSIARTLWLKELQKRKKEADTLNLPEDDCLTEDIYEIYEYNERMFLYRSHFNRLSQKCKKILSLFLDGHTVKEITVIMGYGNDQHTKNRRYRCKKSLINSIRTTFGYKELGYENNKID